MAQRTKKTHSHVDGHCSPLCIHRIADWHFQSDLNMVTAKDEEAVLQSLDRWVLRDGKPITARLLALQSGIPVDAARSYMKQFLDEATSKGKGGPAPFATWILSGPLKEVGSAGPSQQSAESMDLDGVSGALSVSRSGLHLVPDSQLREAKTRFASEPAMTLFSLSAPLAEKPTAAHELAAVTQLITIQHDLKNTPEYINAWHDSGNGRELGSIIPPSDITSSSSKTNQSAIVPPSTVKPNESKVKQEPGKPTTSEKAASKDTKQSSKLRESLSKGDKKEKDSTAMEVDKKQAEVDEEEEEEDDVPIGYADDAIKTDAPAQKGTASRKRADAGEKASTSAEEKRRRRKQELMDLADDGVRDEGGDEVPADIPAAPSTSTDMMGGKADAGDGEGDKKPKQKRRVRKQRKIIRKERATNEKGYKITRDVEDYESYSSDESSEEEVAKGKAGTAKNAKKKSEPSSKASDGTRGKAEAGKAEDLAAKTNAPETKEEDKKQKEKKEDKPETTNKPPPTAKAPPPPPAQQKKTGGSGGPGGQRTLKSFFSKG